MAEGSQREPITTDEKFIGRDDEIKRLKAGLDRVAEGHGVVMMLVGEPAAGKTCTAVVFRPKRRATS